jgi:hypothetical protein
MRDETHAQSVERWAKYVKAHPEWKKEHTAFIDAQFEQSEKFVQRMLKEPKGKEKLRELYGIRNRKDYPSFF